MITETGEHNIRVESKEVEKKFNEIVDNITRNTNLVTARQKDVENEILGTLTVQYLIAQGHRIPDDAALKVNVRVNETFITFIMGQLETDEGKRISFST